MKQLGMRLGEMVLVLIGISFITFCLIMLSPGDPVRQMIAGNEDIIVSQVEIDALRHELGLDKPFLLQYLDWLGRVVQGNFGFSFMMKKPVIDAIMEALPASVILALASSLFMLVFSIPLGIYTAVKQNTWFDYLVRGCTFAGVSVPNFWMGLRTEALPLPDRRRFDFPRKSDPADVHPGYRHGIEIHPSGTCHGARRTASGLRHGRTCPRPLGKPHPLA